MYELNWTELGFSYRICSWTAPSLFVQSCLPYCWSRSGLLGKQVRHGYELWRRTFDHLTLVCTSAGSVLTATDNENGYT